MINRRISVLKSLRVTDEMEKLSAHEKKCREMFNNIENEMVLYISVDRKLSENEFGEKQVEKLSLENNQYVHVSILTDEIIEYDFEMLRSDNLNKFSNGYRPYFVSFVVELEEDNIKQIEALGSDWCTGRYVKDRKHVEANELLLNGVLELSASPVNYLDGNLLVFTDKRLKQPELDKINSLYNPSRFRCTSSPEIEKILNDAWLKDVPQTIDIYNVGHGNADYIRGDKHRILYDIGYNYRTFPSRSNTRFLRAANALRYMKPSCVILSHWDLDHIIGCAYAQRDVFDVKWIAPNLVTSADCHASINSIRLAHYLYVLGNLRLVDREQKNKLIATIVGGKGISFKLWLGSGTSVLTVKNREGLLLEIEDTNNVFPHILLAGDVPYKCMPRILNKKIDFMHVPHHCSKMELDEFKKLPADGICAVISTNRKKDMSLNYDNAHHQELEKKFTNVVNTIDSSSRNDEANLSVQINCKTRSYCFR